MSDQLTAFLARAEQLMERVEAALPHRLLEPDWSASIAFLCLSTFIKLKE